MTISSASNKAQFNGSGSTGPFPFTFKVFAETDLDVIKTDTNSVESVLVLTTDYTVSLNADQNNNPGGSVTTTAAVASGYKLTILRTVAALQETDITNGGGFYPEVMENALDKLTMLVQQVDEKTDRALKLPVSSNGSPDDIATTIYQAVVDAEAAAAAAGTSETNAAASATSAGTSATNAAASASSAAQSAIDAAAYSPGSINGIVKGNGAGAVSAAVAGTDYVAPGTATNFTTPQRAALLTDNDLSFDLGAKQNFKCTPSAGGTLTFTNLADGLSGYVLLVNGSNYAIAKAASVKCSSSFLTTVSATGTYLISYLCDGTSVYVSASGALS